ncbi:Putative diguanylate cyclase (GGDEF) precursor [Bradyrhizobium sp. ORS 285]|uniref:GGDEF domain-containing protein n=1 Tax=Bradyrhizobium sp. ORS 285 TaxID=115808 RepID=UPI000240A0A8|nr:diguanylate cyclase [Bradyrhizobium sp. ORS 285]CCD89292.1 putative diguanylate cyclase (GGDEF) precursor [Bradyrhizobium sp. ORS 285]SMX55903.1 Putative diguanylate cyclase (GGDEF) precursor [Bradyrhizobium sp. ORS 285]
MRWTRRTGRAKLPWRLSARTLVTCSISTIIGFSAICASVMIDLRRGEEVRARQALENLAAGIGADISRNIELYDLSLRAVAGNMLLPEINEVSKPIRHLILFDRASTAKNFGAIQVFDAKGRLAIDSATLDPLPDDRSDTAFFQVHRDRADAGLYVSRPAEHQGRTAIVLSRRISAPDGRFAGVVAGSIRLSYFRDLFGQLSLAPGIGITVFGRDGTIIVTAPFDQAAIGRNLARVPDVTRALSEPSGWSSSSGALDDVPRLLVWRNAGGPLVVVASRSWDGVYAVWRNEAAQIGALMLALIVFVLAATQVAAREIQLRAKVESRLERLATTDPLTGLKNRRKFDETIEIEWRRAQRAQVPLALLMIDADHFKCYNDTHGHQAGDQVLVGIAVCISDSVRRAGDCAARYGGEEFAVLLPATAQADALHVAETIRNKVALWAGEATNTSISVGVASVTPSRETDWTTLMNAADKALYMAKAAGRNRCITVPVPRPQPAAALAA